MDSTTLAMAVLTHPYHVMLMAVALYHALRPMFSDRSGRRSVRPAAPGRADSSGRQAA
jgi:hypothetical protein